MEPLDPAPHARLMQVLHPAPERIAAPCPEFGVCGGCSYQHAPYEYQLARKVEILREQLARVGKLKWEGEVAVVAGEPWAYRNRSQFHIASSKIGYLAAKSHDLVTLDGDCPISSPRVNQGLALLRERLTDPRFPKFVKALEVFSNESELQINVVDSPQPVARRFFEWMESAASLDYVTSHGTFRVSPKSFFQVNRFLVDKLVDAALPRDGGTSALDLYAGVGLFALPLRKQFREVIAVEAGASAARDLVLNATRAEAGIDARHARVEEYLAKLDTAPEFVLADPPRAGLGKQVVRDLERLQPTRLTIVSCDPATLARDLAALVSYEIQAITLVDLFPQTYHLETVVSLLRK